MLNVVNVVDDAHESGGRLKKRRGEDDRLGRLGWGENSGIGKQLREYQENSCCAGGVWGWGEKGG